jgi:hypothetical protein
MDEHIISINQQKENTVQFQVSIEGTDASDITVRLVMDLNNGTLIMFPCVKINGSEYEARIPVLSHIERTAYPCYIEVLTNGYYFKAMKGVINVMGSATITAQPTAVMPKKSPESTKDKEEKDADQKEEGFDVLKTKPTLPSLGVSGVKELAERAVRDAIASTKSKTVKPVVKEEKSTKEETKAEKTLVGEAVVEVSKMPEIVPIVDVPAGIISPSARDINDSKVKNVLESMGITVKPKRQIPKLKINRKT